MWKPGTKRPSTSSRTKTHDLSPSSREMSDGNTNISLPQQSSASPSMSAQLSSPTTDSDTAKSPLSSHKKPKKLSGATMGMRFMQRRQAAAEAAKRQREDQEKIDQEQKHMEWTATTCTSENTVTANKATNNNKRRRSGISGSEEGANLKSILPHTISDDYVVTAIDQEMDTDLEKYAGNITSNPHTNESGTQVPVQIATQSDMYGISTTTQVIGRRSFQNFHKSVETSWKKALEVQQQQVVDEQVEKDHITDEELLKRYEQYVKGRSDMNGSKKSARGNVGNLKNKIKQK